MSDRDERSDHALRTRQARAARPYLSVEPPQANRVIADAVVTIDCYLDHRFQSHREFTDEEEDDYEATCERKGMMRLADLRFNEDGGRLGASIAGLSPQDIADALNLALEALWCARHTLAEAGYAVLLDDHGRWTGSDWRWMIAEPESFTGS